MSAADDNTARRVDMERWREAEHALNDTEMAMAGLESLLMVGGTRDTLFQVTRDELYALVSCIRARLVVAKLALNI